MPNRTLRSSAAALLLLASVACSKTDKTPVPPMEPPATTDAPEKEPPTDDVPATDTTPQNAAVVGGPGGVPLPGDATQNTDMPSAGGKMFVFEIPRAKDDVIAELRTNLAADGWTIDSEEVSPGYGALRLKVSKAGAIVDARVTGDDTKSGIILTLK